MVAGHMTKKNGYWYLILMVRDETGRLKQKWISTHLRVEGNKKKAEAMCKVHKKYKQNSKYERIITIFLGAIGNGFLSAVLIQLLC